ncbi:MAG: 30S ribosomal protein S16 [Elusimicrobia bacterium]|nr:30S ribosomal protein S16 [Elusimicrobiota bacterium]MDE2313345.1 30S ribosomal protein S16 [Elusimicrobiota bacterium]
MAVVLRLQRTGKPKQAYYRVVAIEKARGAHGRPIEILGSYDPRAENEAKKMTVDQERVAYWMKNGAKPSETLGHLIAAQAKAAK